jgi:hypothetical protein
MVIMQARVELPEGVLQQLEMLARREGATPGDLIRRIVEEHVARCQPSAQRIFNVSLPLIPAFWRWTEFLDGCIPGRFCRSKLVFAGYF